MSVFQSVLFLLFVLSIPVTLIFFAVKSWRFRKERERWHYNLYVSHGGSDTFVRWKYIQRMWDG